MRKDGLRGQAWVIFEDVAAATAALQADQGFTFFGKGLKIEYAKEKSDKIAKMEGTYKPRAKRPKLEPEVLLAQPVEAEVKQEATEIPTESHEAVPSQPKEAVPPSNILFAQDVPAECNEMMLSILFRQYPGFKEVRVPRQGLAFAEYENEAQATVALKALDSFKLTNTDVLNLSYAKG